MLKVFIDPKFESNQTGGVARVVEAQRRFLPAFDIEIVENIADAQVYIGHAGSWTTRTDIPRIACCHGMYWSDPMYSWQKWAKVRNAEIARCLVEADMVVTPSEWVADIIRRDLWAPVNVVPNGIDPELINAPVLASASSYVYWNKARIDAVCEIGSLTDLSNRHPEREFVITVPSTRPRPNVKAVGVVPYDRSIELMRHAAVYLATTREVFGVSVLEALAAGVPVLGYAWGGQREQLGTPFEGAIRPEGILVRPGDLDALGEALARMSDPMVWEMMSEAAKERSGAYNWARIMERFAADIHKLWSSWPGHRPAHTPKVTVVIPCYNLGKYLDGAIQSVYRQESAPEWEIVVVDDASTDPETREVLAKIGAGFYDGRTRLIRHPLNLYLAEVLNTGIKDARGEWIINLDADNTLPTHALRDLMRGAAKHPELDCIYGKMRIIREDGSPDSRWGTDGIASYPPTTFNYESLMRHENQVHSSAMFKRRMWERAGGYRQYAFSEGADFPGLDIRVEGKAVRLNSDAEFWTRCASLGFRFGRVVDTTTLNYRMLQGSMSKTVPEWDWTEPSPKHPVVSLGAPITAGRVLSHEPLQLSVIVYGGDPGGVVESLWPQTFDRWEVIVVGTGWSGEPSPQEFLPPYTKFAPSLERAQEQARGRWVLKVDADKVSRFLPDALASFMTVADRAAGVYDESDYSLEGKLMPCGSCGGGLRRVSPMRSRPRTMTLEESTRSAPAPAPKVAAGRRMGKAGGGTLATAPTGLSGKMTLVRFEGSGFRTLYMQRTNPVTRQRFQYVFGGIEGQRKVFVYDEDVARVTANTQYKIVPPSEMTSDELTQYEAINGIDASGAGWNDETTLPLVTGADPELEVGSQPGSGVPPGFIPPSNPAVDPTGGWSALT